jgi:Tfp pilus assembly protein PilX
MTKRRNQRGATLLVALIFLVMMTLFAVTSINMSTVNMRIVGNMQASKQLDADIQGAIEQTLSTMDQFNLTPAQSIVDDVTIDAPTCIDSQVATGYSAVVTNIIPEDNTWEVVASKSDPLTGATSTIHQGVQIRMLAGNCPTPP